MNPSSDLFDLVRSMTPPERRFFRLQARRGREGADPVYLRLYDALLQQNGPEYDESRVKAHFAGEPCLRQFTRTKNYLYGRLLQSLRTFHAENAPRRRCLAALDAADLLADRQLHAQAQREVQRGLDLAHRFDLLDLKPSLLALHRRLLRLSPPPDHRELIPGLEADEDLAQQQWAAEQALNALYDRLWLLSKQRRELQDPEQLEAMRQDDVLAMPLSALGFGGQVAQQLCLALYHRLRGELQASHSRYGAALRTWENHPDMVQAFPGRYLRAVAAFLYSSHAVGDYAEFPALLAQIRSNAHISGMDRVRIAAMAYNLQLLHALNAAPLRDARAPAEALAMELDTGLAPLAVWAPGAMNLAIYHLLAGQTGAARTWLGRLLDLRRSREATDLRELARLLYLLVQYDREEWYLLGYSLRSMVRYVQHRRPLNLLEEQARTFFGAVDRKPDFVERSRRLRAWAADIAEADLSGLMGAEILRIWVIARSRNLDLESIRRELKGL